ncbi:hypothetical protein C8J57DRAFT_1301399 [Mycena rebaudengoi]|nr:hypothetical protein C8J57DRAFT_1301399 [Mycena rebaudengoi]
MSDLTVLVSPIPLYPSPRSASPFASPFASLASRRSRSPSPIMVTLETSPTTSTSPESENAARKHPHDPLLLSPPINTWKAVRRHRPTRSQSAPPTQTAFVIPPREDAHAPSHDPPPRQASVDDLHVRPARRPPPPRRSTAFGYAYVAEGGMTMRGGELVRPPPPLLRPTTFWRRAHRSGVAAASYSPASHLIRRSTYVAAGLPFDAPMHDLSALCVESRIASEDGWAAPRVVEIPQAFELLSLDS